ncbi:MAG: hypothetical protein NVV74_00950 [Magnetospirillum sp.]|nr:hypothetical protein [Magnetospirillum sp.]
MIRLLTAAALAALLTTPVMAQSVSPSRSGSPSGSTMQNQGTTTPGSPSPGAGSPSGSPGLSGQTPIDCLPNDPRPACQTAQLPGQEPGSSSGSATSPSTPPAEREAPSGWGGQGSSGTPGGSSGGSGSMGR